MIEKTLKHIMSPAIVLIIYISIILAFALIYWLAPEGALNEKLSFTKSLYFSIVTITTLGYGDVLPKNDLFMLLISLEAIAGVLIVGLFLNSLWNKYTLALEKEKMQDYKEKNDMLFSYYLLVVEEAMNLYKLIISEIISQQNKELSPFYKFSELASIFDNSTSPLLMARYGYNNKKIVLFYQIEEDLEKQLMIINSSGYLVGYPRLINLITSFMLIKYKYSVKDSLLQAANNLVTLGAEPMQKFLQEETAKHEKIPQKCGLISNICNFHNGLNLKIECFNEIKREISLITSKHTEEITK